MTDTFSPLRPAGAAIAAVLALSSTAVSAQEIMSPPTMPAPAPAPVLAVPQATPAAPAPVIVVPAQPTAPVAVEAPAPSAAREVAPRPNAAARPVARTTASAPVAQTAERAATPAPVAAEPTPADIEFAPAQTALPAESAREPATSTTVENDTGLGAGELGLIGGALAIGGIATAALFARRRRRDLAPEPVDVFAARSAAPPTPLAPQMAVGPLKAHRAAALPAAPTATRQTVATGTGYHVRQAEQGPTADNPFLTRKNRMRRARFLDAQDIRMAGVDQTSAARDTSVKGGDWLDSYRQQNRAASGLSGDWLDEKNPRFAPAGAH